MKLKQIQINRMPGFENNAFELRDLSSGLNIIIGPNESGKTTICKAVQGLLWPERLKEIQHPQLQSAWGHQNHELLIERYGKDHSCRKNGAKADIPLLPDVHLADCFTITIDDLFEGTSGTDSRLAAAVSKDIAGGFDLTEIRAADYLKLPLRAASTAAKQLNSIRIELNKIQLEQKNLHAEKRELADLENKRKEIEEAEKRLAYAQTAFKLHSIDSDLVALKKEINAIPEPVKQLLGNELEVLEDLQKSLAGYQSELLTAQNELVSTALAIDNTNLPKEGISEEKLLKHRNLLSTLQNAESRIHDLQEQEKQASWELSVAVQDLDAEGKEEKLAALNPHALNIIDDFQREYDHLQEKKAAIEERLSILDKRSSETSESEDSDNIERGVALLRQWLRTGSSKECRSKGKYLIIIWLLIYSLALVILLPSYFLSFNYLVLELIPLATAMIALRIKDEKQSGQLLQTQKNYLLLSLDPPPNWEVREVTQLLNSLEDRFSKFRYTQFSRDETFELKGKLESLVAEEEGLLKKKEEIAGQIGVLPTSSVLALSVLGGNIRNYQEKQRAAEGLKAALKERQKLFNDTLVELNNLFAEYNVGCAEAFSDASAKLNLLCSQSEELKLAIQKNEAVAKAVHRIQHGIEACEKKKLALFQNLSLESGDEHALRLVLEELPLYSNKSERLRNLGRQKQSLYLDLSDNAPEFLDLPPEELQEEIVRLNEFVELRDDAIEKITSIKVRIEKAFSGNALEAAYSKFDQAKETLENVYEKALLVKSGNFLLNDIEQAYQIESQPEVFKEANRLFGKFTNERYRLIVGPTEEREIEFQAHNNATNLDLTLEELSRGTRIQLLLAVRFAFAKKHEGTLQIPFLLDEVLSSSDPERFRAVAEALINLVREDRQVFYFSCQPNDGEAWRAIADCLDQEQLKIIDLGKIRNLNSADDSLFLQAVSETDSTESPQGRSMEEYLKILNIPEIVPGQTSDSVHPAHLTDDPELLYKLLQAGISTFGQLRALALQNSYSAYLSEENYKGILARASIMDAFSEAWAIGRGKPLTPEVIQSCCGTKSLSEIIHKAEELRWDSAALIEAIDPDRGKEIKKLRRNVFSQFCDKLLELGYYSLEEPLDKWEALAHVLALLNEKVEKKDVPREEIKGFFEALWKIASGEDS